MSAMTSDDVSAAAAAEDQAAAGSETPSSAEVGAEGGATAPPGVLRKDSTRRESGAKRESKNVMFSDGIRPGGDLTELDASTDAPNLATRISRRQRGQRGSRNSGESQLLSY